MPEEEVPVISPESIANIAAAMDGKGEPFAEPSAPTETPIVTPEGEAPVVPDPPSPSESAVPSAAPDHSWFNDYVPDTAGDTEKFKTGLKGKFDSLQSEIETLRKAPVDVFANDTLRELNAFAKATGLTDSSVYSKVNSLSLEDKSISNMLEIINVGETLSGKDTGSVSIREKILKREYGDAFITDEQISEMDETEQATARENREIAKYRLREKATSAYEKITETRTKITENQPVPLDPEVQRRQQQERTEAYKKVEDKLVEDLKIEIFDFKVENGKPEFSTDVLQSITFDEAEKGEYRSYVAGYLSNIGATEVTESVMKGAESIAKSLLVWNNLPKIIKQARDEGRNAAIKEGLAKMDNPSAIEGKQERTQTGGGAGFDAKGLVDAM